jgi:hypothetical protein
MLAGVPRASRAQDAERVRARLAWLQQQESIILEHRNWWLARLRDPDSFLLPMDPEFRWDNDKARPRFVRRSDVIDQANRLAAAYLAMRIPRPFTAAELIQDAERQSAAVKQIFEQTLIPAFERDLQVVRDEFNALMPQRTVERQAPPIAPSGRAWYFRRPLIGFDQTNPDFTILDSNADEKGGYIQARGRVQASNCFETWQMKWTFGQDVSRLQAGMQIPVTLEAQLVSAPCPSVLQSYIGAGSGRTEQFIMNNAPSPVLESAMVEQGERAGANGSTRYGTARATIRVERNPGQSNAWTLFRLIVWVPGQFWVVAYMYLAGSG